MRQRCWQTVQGVEQGLVYSMACATWRSLAGVTSTQRHAGVHWWECLGRAPRTRLRTQEKCAVPRGPREVSAGLHFLLNRGLGGHGAECKPNERGVA